LRVKQVFVNLSDLEAVEKITFLMAKHEGKITIMYESGWKITFEKISH